MTCWTKQRWGAVQLKAGILPIPFPTWVCCALPHSVRYHAGLPGFGLLKAQLHHFLISCFLSPVAQRHHLAKDTGLDGRWTEDSHLKTCCVSNREWAAAMRLRARRPGGTALRA